MRQRPQGQMGAASSTETHAFARQPLGTAVLAHMDHHLTPVNLSQPEVLGQVTVRWRQVRRMQISDLVRVIAPVRLQQNHKTAVAQTMDGKAMVFIQITGMLRFSPAAGNQGPGFDRDGVPPGLVGR